MTILGGTGSHRSAPKHSEQRARQVVEPLL